jgi:CheY-like chemotaxis protein
MVGRRVLVVDDELGVRELLQSLLRHLGHTSEGASCGAEALRKIEQAEFDLFFADLHMPVMKGDELAREIKRRKPGATVVLITGGELPGPLPEIDRLLRKPFSLAELQDTISSLP